MSKNLTRKGIAFGALLALSASAFAGTPAFAADVVTTSPNAGTSYNTLNGNTNALTLKTLLAPSLNGGNETALKYRILNPTGASLYIKVGNTTTAVAEVASADNDTADVFKYSDNSAITTTAGVVTATDFVVKPLGASDGEATESNFIVIGVTDDVTATVTVQAWIDSAAGADNHIDSVEDVAASQSVNFYKLSDVTYTTSITAPIPGATTIGATVTASPELNGNYATAPTVKFTRQGSSAEIESASLTWSEAAKNWGTATVNLAANNWVGMPNIFQLSTSEGVDTGEVTKFATSASHGLAAGDVVSTFPSNVSLAGTSNAVSATGLTTTLFRTTAESAISDEAEAADTGYIRVVSKKLANVAASKTAATFETAGAHNLKVGDKVTVAADAATFDFATPVAVASVPSSTKFTLTFATALDAAIDEAADAGLVTYESFDEIVPGDYTAQAFIGATKVGAKASIGTVAAAAASIKIASTGSANVQGVSKVGAAGTIFVKTGTTSVDVLATVLDEDGAALGAGRAVTVTPSAAGTGNEKVNAKTAAHTVTTDTNGQVKIAVTAPVGVAADAITVTLRAEGDSATDASFTIDWAAQAFGLVDLATTGSSLATSTRTIVAGSSYDLQVAVTDQWFTAADSAAYRLKVEGAGVVNGAVSLTAGKATVKVTDNKLSTVSFASQITLQKLVSGVWTDQGGTQTITNVIAPATPAINLGAAGSSLYGDAVVTSSAVAAKALVELDKRSTLTDSPAYENNLVLNGQVVSKSSGASVSGAVVTISGASNILFEDGLVAKKGSLTLVSGTDGKFQVKAYSTTAQTDSVVTVSALGVSSTVKVTFTGIGVGEGTALTATVPSRVAAASTFQVAAKLADAYGNGVEATAGRVKVTYTGAGIVFGTLPDKTDKNGALSFSALLGAADKGAVTVTVQYDQNGDADFVDAKDLTVTKTVLVAVSAKITKPAKGATVTVKNASGLTIKVVRGSKSTTKVATSNTQKVTLKSGTGKVNVYVNGIKVASK